MKTEEQIKSEFAEMEFNNDRAEENNHKRTRGYKKYRNPMSHVTPKKKKRK